MRRTCKTGSRCSSPRRTDCCTRAVCGLCSLQTCKYSGRLRVGCAGISEVASVAHVDALSYSIIIEGERGNRPRIYSLEQLLQEAVRPGPRDPMVPPHLSWAPTHAAHVPRS